MNYRISGRTCSIYLILAEIILIMISLDEIIDIFPNTFGYSATITRTPAYIHVSYHCRRLLGYDQHEFRRRSPKHTARTHTYTHTKRKHETLGTKAGSRLKR